MRTGAVLGIDCCAAAGDLGRSCLPADAGHGALVFGDLNDENGRLAKILVEKESDELRSDLKLNTAVRYSGI